MSSGLALSCLSLHRVGGATAMPWALPVFWGCWVPFPGVPSPEGSSLCWVGGGGRAEIWAEWMLYLTCPWFACWEMLQGSFLPLLSTIGSKGDLEGPHSQSWGWAGAGEMQPLCVSQDWP